MQQTKDTQNFQDNEEVKRKLSRTEQRALKSREAEANNIIRSLCDKVLILYTVNPDNVSQQELEHKIKEISVGWRLICKRKNYTAKAYPIIDDFYKSLVDEKSKLLAE